MTPDSADTAGAGGSTDPPDSLRPRMTLNGYTLELGAEPGMIISEVAEPASSEARALAEALDAARAQPRPQGAIAESLSETIEDASEVTSRAERAVTLFRAVAEGRVLDPNELVGEVDALLALLDRLDKEGRYKEALGLARSLSGLLALLMRWAELARSLRLALRAAEAIGDMPGVAFVKHQLGTLELVAGDTRAAERNLGEAREIRQRLDDRRALAATERNLQFLCHQLRDMLRKGRLKGDREDSRFLRRRLLVALVAGVLLLTGGVAGAVVDGGDDSPEVADATEGVSVTIRAPVEGARFAAGDRVVADYSCSDGDEPAESCRGNVPDGEPIETTKGVHTFTVTATADDGRQATETVSYRVSDRAPKDRTRPTIQIVSPRSGVIPADARPRAEFRCTDPPGGSGIASCRATDEDGRRVANGDALNVAVGSHTLTVIAADAAGNTARRAVTYEISRGGRPECRDRADNDGDRLRDGKDPGCSDGTEAPADRPTECADNIDNDGDGPIDAGDPGCGDGTEADAEPPPVEQAPPLERPPNSEQPVP